MAVFFQKVAFGGGAGLVGFGFDPFG